MAQVDYEGWGRVMDWARERQVELRLEHLEEMAAAYFAKTDIPPEEVVLVEDMTEARRIRFYFERREKL